LILSLLAVLSAGLLAGCGGGSSKSSASSTGATSTGASTGGTLSASEYVAQANAICKATRGQTSALIGRLEAATTAAVTHPSASAAAPLLALVTDLHDSAGATVARLQALKGPAATSQKADAFLTPLSHAITILGKAAAGLSQGHAKTAVDSLFQLQSAAPSLASAAQAAGLTACEGVLSAGG
jgi:hypothetical protein